MGAYSSNGTYQYAGGTPAGIVTVGSVGKERRIQNVAAGLVSAKSTDAVNGSQLYTMTRPLRFAGDNSTIGNTSEADVNVLHRGSDQAMSLLGGADSNNLSDDNIGVVANSANNTMTVKLAKDVTGLNSITSKTVNAETVKAGDTTINNQGVTITGGPSVTKEGINANGTKITNVAAGTADTDAVNVSQLTKQSADLTEKGFGLKDQDGNIVHKSLGEDIEVTGDGKNISTKVENGTMKVVLNDDLNVTSVTTADTNGNKTVTQGSGMTITDKDGNETTIGAGGITIAPKNPAPGTSPVSLTEKGRDNGGNQIHNVAAGTAETDAVNVSQLKDEIAKIDHVQSVEYISPSDALVELKKDWGADEDIFVGLDGENNPLSHSFSISLDNIENQDAVLTALEKIDGIDNIRHGQTETEVLLKASRVFNVGSVLVMLLLGVISIMIIINTIRISVMNRRVEINIMKYVGATDWFIRWPFIVEGIIIGIIGALVPLVLGLPIYTKVTSAIFDYLPVIKFIQFRLTGDVFGFLFPFGIVFGVALGVIGSVSSIRKHLRV